MLVVFKQGKVKRFENVAMGSNKINKPVLKDMTCKGG